MPACRSLDCVSVFALTVEDAVAVADVACGLDLGDPGSRPDADGFRFQPTPRPPQFRFGVPAGPALSFLGDGRTAELYERAVVHLRAMGGERVDIDFAPFREAGSLLYEGAFVAERLEAAGRTLAENPEALVGPVRTILEGATRFDARAAFEAQHRLAGLRRRAGALLRQVDFLFVPTTPTIYAIDEVEASPLRLNAQLGTYVNFVNLLDLAAMAVPLGFRTDGLPAGATLIAPWGRDASLATFGSALHRKTSQTMGATDAPLRSPPAPAASAAGDERIEIAVVGAHLSGEPLNHQLIELGARFVRAARTAAALPAVCAAGHDPGQARHDARRGARRRHRARALVARRAGIRPFRLPRPAAAVHRHDRARRRPARQRLPVRTPRPHGRDRYLQVRRLAGVPALAELALSREARECG